MTRLRSPGLGGRISLCALNIGSLHHTFVLILSKSLKWLY